MIVDAVADAADADASPLEGMLSVGVGVDDVDVAVAVAVVIALVRGRFELCGFAEDDNDAFAADAATWEEKRLDTASGRVAEVEDEEEAEEEQVGAPFRGCCCCDNNVEDAEATVVEYDPETVRPRRLDVVRFWFW